MYDPSGMASLTVRQGIDLLEAAMNTSPSSVVVAEPFLFNLCTCLLSAHLSFPLLTRRGTCL